MAITKAPLLSGRPKFHICGSLLKLTETVVVKYLVFFSSDLNGC